MFHKLPEGMAAAEFSDMLKDVSAKYYGAFWDAWVAGVTDNIKKLRKWVPENLPKLTAELCAGMDINDPVTKRMVNGMAGWLTGDLSAFTRAPSTFSACRKEILLKTGIDVRGDPSEVSGHSLRSGFCTQAAMSDIPNWMVRETTGHTSDAMLNLYCRPVKRRKIPSLL